MNDEDPISLKKAVFFCSYLGLPYSTEMKNKNLDVVRKKLLQKIDMNIMHNKESLAKLVKMKDQERKLETYYFINLMKEKGLISFRGNLYFYGDHPIGQTDDSVFRYFEGNPEVFEKSKEDLKGFLNFEEKTLNSEIESKEVDEDELEDLPI